MNDLRHTIVHYDPQAYCCFPDILRAADGCLWVTFRRAGGFSLEALRRGKYDHVDKGARIALARSTDDGHAWVLHRIFPPFDSECGEQDPSIAQVAPGTMLINFFRWRVVPAGQEDRLGYPARQQYDGSWSDVEGPWVIRSFDRGSTWEARPHRVDSRPLPRAGTSDAVLALPGGTLLMGLYGADYGSHVCRAYTVRSEDGGATWGGPAIIAADPAGRLSFEEPALAATASGQLLAMLRCGEPGRYEYLYQACSADGGHTWTDLHQTPLWGHPAHLLRLADGRLLCSYGYRRPPYGVRACLSHDGGGRSWDVAREVILRDNGASRDVGYPSSAQLADGSLVTVYYIHGEDGVRHIAATHWRVD